MLSAPLLPRKLRSLLLTGAFALAAPLLLTRPAHADQWALLIGIDHYEDADTIANLGGADNDANALAKTLTDISAVPADHIIVLTSGGTRKPLKRTILHELEVLKHKVHPGDTVFIAYSGHGVESEGVPYLLPYDADISAAELIRSTSIPEETFRDYLKAVPAKALVLVFDMCRVNADKLGKAGPTEDAHLSDKQVRGLDFSPIVQNTTNNTAPPTDHPQIVAEFFACSRNSRSYEWRDKQRGYFSYFLEQGLRGQAAASTPAGTISLDALKRYLSLTVPAAVRENGLGKEQTPTGDIVGPLDAGDFILANTTAPIRDEKINTHATLHITINAPNPTITVEGRPLTPGTDFVANLAGEETRTVKVAITAPGYDGEEHNVELRKGITTSREYNLVALPPTAPVTTVTTAVVNTTPPIHINAKLETLIGHSEQVNAASFSPDGRYILTGSDDGTAIVWDAQTGNKVRTLTEHTNAIAAASFSPDGRYIVTGHYHGTAIIWDVQTGEKVRTLAGHRGSLTAASFSADGHYIVTASVDNTAIVWDAQTGEKVRTLTGHTANVFTASFSPDGRYIVTASMDHTAIVWDARTGKPARTLAGHSNTVLVASFSPDGRYIVTASMDHTAVVWDAQTGQQVRTLKGYTDTDHVASFSPDGRYIVTGSDDNTGIVWDAQTGEKVRTLKGHSYWIIAASFSPDSRYIVTGSYDHTAKVWDVATGKSAE